MARTPLLLSLRRMAYEHRLARAHGLPLDVVRTEQALARAGSARSMTRRELLAGAMAATASLALPRPARARRDAEIAIVGAGIAGLTTALTLADHGVASQVYEASGRVGGRMFTNAGRRDRLRGCSRHDAAYSLTLLSCVAGGQVMHAEG